MKRLARRCGALPLRRPAKRQQAAQNAEAGRGGGYGSIVSADNVLLALTPASDLIVIRPDDKKLKEVSRIKVDRRLTPIRSFPATVSS
jgi:hypothetical protein